MMKETKYATLMNIWNAFKEREQIAIFRHVNPDPDAYGSQFALARILKDNFPEKKIYCYGELVKRLEYIYDDCKEMYLNPIADLTNTLVVTVDTANKERIDKGNMEFDQVDIKIDHHPGIDPYAKNEFVNTNIPATCAILLDFFLYLEKENPEFILSESVYKKLYAGIVGDTGNFAYGAGLNQEFFTNVGRIFEKINTKEILQRFFQKSLEEIKFKGYLTSIIQAENTFAYVEFNSDIVEEHEVTLDYATGLVNIMSEIENVAVWASFCEDKQNDIIRCSVRSRFLDISGIAQQFGGGGHPNASGIRVKTWDEVEKIKDALRSLG